MHKENGKEHAVPLQKSYSQLLEHLCLTSFTLPLDELRNALSDEQKNKVGLNGIYIFSNPLYFPQQQGVYQPPFSYTQLQSKENGVTLDCLLSSDQFLLLRFRIDASHCSWFFEEDFSPDLDIQLFPPHGTRTTWPILGRREIQERTGRFDQVHNRIIIPTQLLFHTHYTVTWIPKTLQQGYEQS